MIKLKGQISVVRLYGKLGGEGAIEESRTVAPSPDVQVVTPSVGYVGMASVTVGGVTLQEKNVSPTSEPQTVLPDAGYYGLSKVNVAAMKDGGMLQDKTVSPSTKEQKVSADSGYYGLNVVTVEAAPLEEVSVSPMATAQEITPSTGNYGLSKVTVEAAVLEELTVTPSSEVQTFEPTSPCIGFSIVTVEAAESGGGGDIIPDEPSYPAIEDGGLTYELTDVEVPTGRYVYGSKVADTPCPEDYPYMYLHYYNNNTYMIETSVPLYFSSSNTLYPHEIFGYSRYKYDETAGSWTKTDSAPAVSVSPFPTTSITAFRYWANYDVTDKAGTTVYIEGSEPVPEVEVKQSYAPVGVASTLTISGATVSALGACVYQITGQMPDTPEGMIAALNYYAAQHKTEETTE